MPTLGRRRALGQHFLKDSTVAKTIAHTVIEEASLHQCFSLLEIGPGKGAITLPILDQLGTPLQLENNSESQLKQGVLRRFLVVERDKTLVTRWREHRSLFPLKIEEGDFLDLPEEKWLSNLPLAVVSNLPYSVGTAILNRLARRVDQIPVMVLMFQSEVAKRLRAEASTPERGSLSLWIQNRWNVRKLLGVPPQAFSPPPEVNSEVVVLTRRPVPWVQIDQESEVHWETFLKTCFAHRRKMLRSSLPWKSALELSGVDGTKRAEALQWNEWDRLFQAVRKVMRSSVS